MRKPKLNEFCKSYIETALWSTTDNSDDSGGEPLDRNYDIGDIAPATLRQMVKDCNDFRRSNKKLLHQSKLSLTRQGHNFWLTRERHGAGFWDEGLGRIGDELTKSAHAYGSFDLYVGDDGKVHGS